MPLASISTSSFFIASQASSQAKSFSSSVMSRCSRKASKSCLRSSVGSIIEQAGSRYLIPRCAKKSVSFVNAAFSTLGAPATIGHDV